MSAKRLAPVTQADRDAAADLEYAVGDKGLSHAIRSGGLPGIDQEERTQAFARHRLAERERAAVCADGYEYLCTGTGDIIPAEGARVAQEAIAVDIRYPKNER